MLCLQAALNVCQAEFEVSLMRIGVVELKREPGSKITVPVQIALEPVEMSAQMVQFDRPFTGQAVIWNAGDRLLVQAELSGEALVVCSRCLTPFTLPLDVEFEEEYVEGAPGEARAENRDDEDEEDGFDEQRTITYYSGDEIDLTDSLRDNVLLELPMQPICSRDCKGLCPTCGTNLNEGACTCTGHNEVVDSRFDKLKDLLGKPDSNQ